MNKSQFIQALANLKRIPSKTGRVTYSGFKIEGSTLDFKRDNPNTNWTINIDELFNAYTNLDFINTINIKKYITDRTYSPACAILIALGLYDRKGNRMSKK